VTFSLEETLTEQGRNFANKIWNAFRLISSWKSNDSISQPESSYQAIRWFENKLDSKIILLDDHYSKYRISDALMTVYKLFWDEFSSWYLEIIKPDFQKPIDPRTLDSTINFLEKLLKIIHPFMPFITEELWQLIKKPDNGQSIMISEMPQPGSVDDGLIKHFEDIKEVTANVRKIRKEKLIPVKDKITLKVRPVKGKYNDSLDQILTRLLKLSDIELVEGEVKESVQFIVKSTEYFVPVSVELNVEEELKRLSTELEYSKSFLTTIGKKLNNKNFVDNAPQKIVDIEKKKQSDTLSRIKVLEDQIKNLNN